MTEFKKKLLTHLGTSCRGGDWPPSWVLERLEASLKAPSRQSQCCVAGLFPALLRLGLKWNAPADRARTATPAWTRSLYQPQLQPLTQQLQTPMHHPSGGRIARMHGHLVSAAADERPASTQQCQCAADAGARPPSQRGRYHPRGAVRRPRGYVRRPHHTRASVRDGTRVPRGWNPMVRHSATLH